MPRIARSSTLETREARSRLKQQHAPYWRKIHKGLAIGYRKGTNGGVWIIRRAEGPSYRFESVGSADDHAEANGVDVLSYAQAHRRAFDESDKKAEPSGYTVRQAVEDYLAWFRAHRKSIVATESTINAHILPHFENKPVAKLTSAELVKWHKKIADAPIRRRGGKAQAIADDPDAIRKRKASANRVLTVAKAIFNHAWHNGKVKDNSEWARVKPFHDVEESRKIILQPEQIRRLVNVTQGAFREWVQALSLTGCRPGVEVEFIRVRDFDRESGTIQVPDSKTGARVVYLSNEGIKFFSRLTVGKEPDALLLAKDDGNRWGKNHHARPWKAAAKKAKLPAGATPYSLRHSYISMALLGGANLKIVADSCGTSVRMLETHYAKFLAKDRRNVINAALPSFGFKQDKKVVRMV